MPRAHGKLAADFIALFHAFWVCTALAAVPMVIIDPWYKKAVAIFMLIMGAMWVLWRGDCPLRVWEVRLRKKFDPVRYYDGAFIAHYLHHLIGIQVSTPRIRTINWAYSALVLTVLVFR